LSRLPWLWPLLQGQQEVPGKSPDKGFLLQVDVVEEQPFEAQLQILAQPLDIIAIFSVSSKQVLLIPDPGLLIIIRYSLLTAPCFLPGGLFEHPEHQLFGGRKKGIFRAGGIVGFQIIK
jgi:hypothetical protein